MGRYLDLVATHTTTLPVRATHLSAAPAEGIAARRQWERFAEAFEAVTAAYDVAGVDSLPPEAGTVDEALTAARGESEEAFAAVLERWRQAYLRHLATFSRPLSTRFEGEPFLEANVPDDPEETVYRREERAALQEESLGDASPARSREGWDGKDTVDVFIRNDPT